MKNAHRWYVIAPVVDMETGHKKNKIQGEFNNYTNAIMFEEAYKKCTLSKETTIVNEDEICADL